MIVSEREENARTGVGDAVAGGLAGGPERGGVRVRGGEADTRVLEGIGGDVGLGAARWRLGGIV